MRALAVCCLVAACGNDPGLMLVIQGKTADVASVEVFLPDNVDDSSGIGMPPANSALVDGAVFSVIDSVKTTVSGDARILLQPGDTHDVPGLLVLAYDGNGTPIAKTVVRNSDGSWIHLPSTNTVEVQIKLEPVTYVPPMNVAQTTGPRVTRWSATNGPQGDLSGGCIAVLDADGNSFFDTKDDPDCDGKQPDCNDRMYDFVDPSPTPPKSALCASRDFKTPDTGRACRLGQTVACTDGIGTCAPVTGTAVPPICVPEALCKSCPNSDSTDPSDMSGIDMACEQDAKMNGDDVPYVDCDLDAMVSTDNMQPCMDNLPALDFSMYAGAGWGCSHLVGFYDMDMFGTLVPGGGAPPGDLSFGLDSTGATAYILSANCPSQTAPTVQFTMSGVNQQMTPISKTTTAEALLMFGTKPPTGVSAFAEIAVPFHLHFHPATQCRDPNSIAKCQLKTLHSGDFANDHIWSGCAGAM